jgi:putative alpha-1,2-mannosidase
MILHTVFTFCLTLVLATLTLASQHNNNGLKSRSGAASNFVGYLISTFSDANPTVQFYLSKGNDPSSYSFLNRGRPALSSSVGTRAVRDVFLAVNGNRTQWFMIGTG